MDKIKSLGPIAKAIYGILVWGSVSDKKREDPLRYGITIKNTPLGGMSGSFLVFRGVLMKQTWLKDWKRKAGGADIGLHGTTSVSRNLEIALELSKCDTNKDNNMIPVLFVYTIRNYKGFSGFRNNDGRYSAFPCEQEYLLIEGTKIYILSIQENFVIESNYNLRFNGNKLTVIYCLNNK